MKKLALLLSLLALGALGLVACEADDDVTTAVNAPRTATLSPEQRIEQTGRKWALLFAASRDRAACKVMSQPGCAQLNCEYRQRRLGAPDDVIPIRNCTPPSPGFRKSFADATIQDIAIKGHRAGARFSNGEGIELFWVNGYAVGGVWWIGDFGGNAGGKFFEPGAKLEDDREAGVRLSLDGRVLTARLLASGPPETRRKVRGERIRASCGTGWVFHQGYRGVESTRLWPAGRPRMRYRFRRDISRHARWCRLEHQLVGHVAFVKFG